MRTTGSTASTKELIRTMARAGYVAARGAEDPTVIGSPRRSGFSEKIQRTARRRYQAADCPFCEGPLFIADQCFGRAVTAAEPYGLYFYDPLPATHIAVACLACEFAFYPLRESPESDDAVGSRRSR